MIYGVIRKYLGVTFHELAQRKGVTGITIEEEHLRKDHTHMRINFPSKHMVLNIVGYLKGTSEISIAKNFRGRQRNFNGEEFLTLVYFVSTVRLDEKRYSIA